MKKKGVSPVVATALLIAIVIVLAAIIFFWARGFIDESAEKFDRAIELSCEDVVFEADVFGDELDVINNGNVPIYAFTVKKKGRGDVIVSEPLGSTLSQGQSDSIDLNGFVGPGDEITVIPSLLGETGSGKVAHECDERYGYDVLV